MLRPDHCCSSGSPDSYERHTLLKRTQLAEAQRLRIVPARFTTDGSLMGAVALVLRGLGALHGGG